MHFVGCGCMELMFGEYDTDKVVAEVAAMRQWKHARPIRGHFGWTDRPVMQRR